MPRRTGGRPAEVVILYKSLPHYRVAFFDQLRTRLQEEGVNLRLVVGRPLKADLSKDDEGSLPWAEVIPNRELQACGVSLVWQPVVRQLKQADLVIVEQANKLLINPLLQCWRRLGGPRLGLWGHGFNRNPETRRAVSEWAKRLALRQTDWWFAYTGSTARYLTSQGVDRSIVTTVNNATDVKALRTARDSLPREGDAGVRRELGLEGQHVGVFIGSLYPAKRPGFLLDAAQAIRQAIPDFELLVIGDGPSRGEMERAAGSFGWIRFVGPLKGEQLARVASVASVLLMPGLVGLAILDGFALGLPIVTSAVETHSPEIDYLQHRVNGIIVPQPEDVGPYADAVVEVLMGNELLDQLRNGCAASADEFTVEAMVERFAAGVLECLRRR